MSENEKCHNEIARKVNFVIFSGGSWGEGGCLKERKNNVFRSCGIQKSMDFF